MFQHSCLVPSSGVIWFDATLVYSFNECNEEVMLHRPNISTLLSSAFIRGDDLVVSLIFKDPPQPNFWQLSTSLKTELFLTVISIASLAQSLPSCYFIPLYDSL